MDNVIKIEACNQSALQHSAQDELGIFLEKWDDDYKAQAERINLFKKDLVRKWTHRQRKHFIKTFYHSRGHFKDFLWHLGNFAPDKTSKDMVLENIYEEFNADHPSHEQLYLDFAKKEGIDLSDEYLENKYHVKKMREFNEIQARWLHSHENWWSKLAAFSAYERLDSTDYELLSSALFIHLDYEHEFFRIHREAKHFDKTYISLSKAWNENKSLVKEAFDFIALAQLEMWGDLSNEVFVFS